MHSTKNIISDVLNIPISPDWEITSKDEQKDLYMVHYSEKMHASGHLDYERYKHIRGIVVDTACGNVVCKNNIEQTEIVTKNIETTKDKNYYLIQDDVSHEIHTFPINETKFTRGYEGIELRVWKDSYGNAHISTSKKIDMLSSNSRTLFSLFFSDYYKMLKGPAPESFFDPSKKFSSFVYILTMVHTDLLGVSKEIITTENGGYIVYLGYKKMNTFYPVEECESIPFFTPSTVNNILPATEYTLESANNHLKYGFYTEKSFKTGEFILASYKDYNYRIYSPDYKWRLEICPDHNRFRNFFLEYVKCNQYSHVLTKQYNVPNQNFNEISQLIRDSYPFTTVISSSVKNSRIEKLIIAFLYAVPINLQETIIDTYLDKARSYINDTAAKIHGFINSNDSFIVSKEINEFIQNINHKYAVPEIAHVLKSNSSPKFIYKICKTIEKCTRVK